MDDLERLLDADVIAICGTASALDQGFDVAVVASRPR
jgi:hypothetical protein